MYSTEITELCRKDLTDAGVTELRRPAEVDDAVNQGGTTLVVINSVCGCAAGNARPAVKLAIQHPKRPDRLTTVFAGVDQEATARTRSYLPDYRPSSPSIALFKDGQPVFMLERFQIEGRGPEEIAWDIIDAFKAHC